MRFPSHVKIAVLPTKCFIELNETSENDITITGGIEAEIVKILSSLFNFKYLLLIPNDREWGALKHDGNWTGLIGMVNRSEADMAISILALTEERNNAVSFVPYSTQSTTFVTGVPDIIPNAYFYADPLENSVWLACFLFLLIFSLFYCLLKPNPPYVVVFLMNLGYFLKQSSRTRNRTLAADFLLGSWILFACILTLAYTAVLLSFMAVPKTLKGVETIKELAEAVSKEKYKCYSGKGTADSEFLLKSDDDSLQYLGRMIQENGWLFNGESLPDQLDNDMALIGIRSLIEIERDSDITNRRFIFKENLAVWSAGIAVDRRFCCTRSIATALSRMRSSGIYEKLFNREVHRAKLLKYKSYVPDVREVALTIEHIYGTFILLFGGYAISSLVLICEIIANWWRDIGNV